jgi:holo-[acyl-carrier protein] synthase
VPIVGVGIDVVDVVRLAVALERTPRLAERLFTQAERTGRSVESLAARFAAKEAVAKVLGAPGNLSWLDAEVVSAGNGRPHLRITGAAATEAEVLQIRAWHVSLSHDGGYATAMVVAES